MWSNLQTVISNYFSMRPDIFIELIKAFSCSLVSGFLSAYVAKKKGYSYATWFLIGFVAKIYGLIAIAGLPLKKNF